MKVVLFCGGYGMRMRGSEHDSIPKPMQMVGPRPLLWHIMRYYAHFGHKEFVLCLGYGSEHIKDYFLHYQETSSNNFTLRHGEVELESSEISDWSITFVHTGLNSSIGERLWRVRDHVAGDEIFLANYADVLSDVDLDVMVDTFKNRPEMVASMIAVPPQFSFHVLDMPGNDGVVSGIKPVSAMPWMENGGYLMFRQEFFDYLDPKVDKIEGACATLASERRLLAQPYRGFWKPADTFKERAELDALWATGERPWARWETQKCSL